jgi:uncharacterized OsmC-like protein
MNPAEQKPAASRSTMIVNGIAPDELRKVAEQVAQDPRNGKVKLGVLTEWKGGLKTHSCVKALEIGQRTIPRNHTIVMDEPAEFLGGDTAPNPQEMLIAAFNACVLSGYITGCALEGIAVEALAIETEGELDLRGFLGLDPAVRPGYGEIAYVVRIRSNGTPEQLQRIHEQVLATSPNRWNLANAVRVKTKLLVEPSAT